MGCQCPKRLWLYKNRRDLLPEISVNQQLVFEKGIDVGVLARSLFPGGLDASPPDYYQYPLSIQQTKKWVESSQKIIYEAAFQYNEVMAALDILEKRRGKWYAYEVKSSTEIKDYQIMDAALQYYIMNGSGLELADIFIIFLNKEYTRKGELDLANLFSIQSVKKEILALQPEIPARIQSLKKILDKSKEPELDIGQHCSDPFPCDFSGYCWSHIPPVSIFDIANLRSLRKFELYSQGIIRLEEIPDGFRLTESQQMQVRAYLDNKPVIDSARISGWVKELQYPLYFMDFETFMPAVPLYQKTRPYQHIPFQFSVHRQETPDGPLKHTDYLGEPETDPRREFIEQLIRALDKKGSVIVYNKGFEQGRLKELAASFPEYAKALMSISDRIADLMDIFRNKWYYLPTMNGSFSIKNVLPALVPGFSYDELEIGEGGMAMAAFEGLLKINNKEERERIKNALLKYCERDTEGMVKVLEKLLAVSRNLPIT